MSWLTVKYTRGKINGIGDTTPIVKDMRKALYVVLQQHFKDKDNEGNKEGFYRSHFWNKEVRANTFMGLLTAKRGEVNIASAPYAHKISGGTITPKTAKSLAIPAISAAKKAKTPSLVMDDPSFTLVPFKGKGNLVGMIIKRTLSKKKNKARKSKRKADTVWWWLLKKVTQKADPTAKPDEKTTEKAVYAAGEIAYQQAFRKANGIRR